jgi:hypothetical protein
MADIAMPVSGGTLDQSANFLEALTFYRGEVAMWEAQASRG